MRILILCGGRSAEHEVSLHSAGSILNQLDRRRYRLTVIGIAKDGSAYPPDRLRQLLAVDSFDGLTLPETSDWVGYLSRNGTDIAFPVLHGPFGEDGTVQGLFEVLGLPYVGAGVCGSAVGMNKIHCKQVLLSSGLPVLPYLSCDRGRWEAEPQSIAQRAEALLSYPMFVKPANLGSSVGVNKSKNRSDLARHLEAAFRYDDWILIEQGIEARDVETSVLGNLEREVSIAGEIIPSREFYSYEAKYLDEASRLVIPAPLSEDQLSRIQQLALSTCEVLQLEGMARVDFLVDKQSGEIWVNEPNTIPGFTRISMYPKLWEASGLPYPRLLDRLIELGLERHRRRRRFSVER